MTVQTHSLQQAEFQQSSATIRYIATLKLISFLFRPSQTMR